MAQDTITQPAQSASTTGRRRYPSRWSRIVRWTRTRMLVARPDHLTPQIVEAMRGQR
jgi:hypothetical protein